MSAHPFARVACGLAAVAGTTVAPLACATRADQAQRHAAREAALARIPANAPAGVLANGRWTGSVTGEWRPTPHAVLPHGDRPGATMPRMRAPTTRTLTVEVAPWRDSARVALVIKSGASSGSGGARTVLREVRVVGDTMTFGLPTALGWRDMTCRLVERRSRTWDGSCVTSEGERAVTLTLDVPRQATRQGTSGEGASPSAGPMFVATTSAIEGPTRSP